MSGYQDIVLRPLSARLLPVTLPEERGWVDRDRLMDFSGRSRKPQMALAEKLHIKEYPSPAGGCLLTEKVFSRRLRDLLDAKPDPEIYQLTLERIGCAPEEAVFIDDKRENVESAEKLGIHGIIFRGREQAIEELEAIISADP